MIAIRREAPGDEAAIRAVHTAAFPTGAEAQLVDAMRANGHATVSLVALLDDRIVGHVSFSPVTIRTPDRAAVHVTGLGLAPIGVLPECQGQGIGSRLITEGLTDCAREDVDFVVVLGEPSWYRGFGFERADARELGNEYGATDAFMVLELRSGALGGVRGLVRYGAEFRLVA